MSAFCDRERSDLVTALAYQRLTCSHCPQSWVRLVLIENGGVTNEALDPVRCASCRREVDPWIDGEMLQPVRAGLVAA